jgi:hypothetical protein
MSGARLRGERQLGDILEVRRPGRCCRSPSWVRSWLDDKHVVIEELGRLLREPTLQPVNKNVHLLRVTWGTMPLHGDQEFEAMLNDRRNNAPVPGS